MGNRTVSVALQAKVNDYVSGMNKAEKATVGVKKSTQDAEAAAKKYQSATDKAALGVAARSALIGTAVAAGVGYAIKAASDLNETQSKTNVVFGDSASAVEDWSKRSATAMGQSQQQAMEAAATYGNLFVSMGLAESKAASMSTNLVQLAGDLASFNNTSPTDALDALRSGLVGEVEPLRRYGVNLNDATLRQKALDMGLTKTTKDVLPPAIRTQAAYALILEQTTTAQGDFQRTSSGLANQQRIFKAELDNTAATLGQSLLPAATGVLRTTNELLEVFQGLPGPMRNTIVTLGLLALGWAAVGGKITSGVDGAKTWIATMRATAAVNGTTAGSFRSLAAAEIASLGPLALIVASVGAAVAVGLEWQKSSKMAADAQQHWNDTMAAASPDKLNKLAESLSDVDGRITAVASEPALFGGLERSADHASMSLDSMTRGLGLAGQGMQDTGQAGTALEQGQNKLNAVMTMAARISGMTRAQVKGLAETYGVDLNEGVGYAADQLISMADSGGIAAGVTDDLASSEKVLGDATATTADKVKALRTELDLLNGARLDERAAARNYQAALDEVSGALKNNGRTLNINTEKGRANQAVLDGIASKALAVADAQVQMDGDTKRGTATMQRARGELIKAYMQFDHNKGRAEAYANAILRIPKSWSTSLNMSTAAAERAASFARQKIAAEYRDNPVYLEARIRVGKGVPTHADGGRFQPGLALVGEEGPELVAFEGSGVVHTATQTKQILNGARPMQGGTSTSNRSVTVAPGALVVQVADASPAAVRAAERAGNQLLDRLFRELETL